MTSYILKPWLVNTIAIAGTIKNQNKIAVNKFHPINIENGINTTINAIGTINVPLKLLL